MNHISYDLYYLFISLSITIYFHYHYWKDEEFRADLYKYDDSGLRTNILSYNMILST